ncbi:MAG: hypothetical protein HDR55_04805 [Treponema sp.]|nr:hypothetical protein [Treponema sp.]
MRYSIFEYSQERLLENALDVVDALILNWFVNFFSGKMEKRIFKESDGSQGLYGWVKPSKIMEDLPVIGISSDKGVRRRLDGLVEKGILKRKTVQFQAGKRSYYCTTELYDSLVNIKASATAVSSSQRNWSTFAENSNVLESPQGSKTTFATSESTEKASQRNWSAFAENSSALESPQRSKTTFATNESTEKGSQRSKTTFATNESTEKGSQRNWSTFAERNSSSFALNDSRTSDIKTTAAAEILKSSEKVFGKDAFDENFPKKFMKFLDGRDISDYEGFFNFIKDRVEQKKAENPRGMAYKLIFSPDICREYQNECERILEKKQEDEKRERKKKEREMTCPVCGMKFLPDYLTSCPKCAFEIHEFEKAESIVKYKKYLTLSHEERKNYDQEVMSFMNERPLAERFAYFNSEEGRKQKMEFLKALDRKYRLTG